MSINFDLKIYKVLRILICEVITQYGVKPSKGRRTNNSDRYSPINTIHVLLKTFKYVFGSMYTRRLALACTLYHV